MSGYITPGFPTIYMLETPDGQIVKTFEPGKSLQIVVAVARGMGYEVSDLPYFNDDDNYRVLRVPVQKC